MSIGELIRRRRIVARQREAATANAGLLAAARDFRARAQAEADAGHPELGEPWLAEARLFEGAARPVPGL